MIKTLFVCYDNLMSETLRKKFEADFKSADQIILLTVIAFSFTVAFITSWQHSYFILGIVGGGLVTTVSIVTYKIFSGTFFCRLILSSALVAILAISVQQSNGLGEGHFIFFLGFTILIRYRDIVPLLNFVGLTVVHHLGLTYCQSIGAELWGQPIAVFSWGAQSDWGLLAPLAYHVTFAVLALIISTYYILDGNKRFVESNTVIGAIEQAAEGDLTARIDVQVSSTLIESINNFFERLTQMIFKIEHVTEILTSLARKTKLSAQEMSHRSGVQQEEVTMVATAVTEMVMATQEIAKNAEVTAQSSRKTVEISEQGGGVATTCKHSINQLAEQVNNASSIISELDQNSQQISNIVSSIRGIAEQTNLLALNAAIEAARAGEQGRGFAVVADEVRVLSQRTHASTEEISSMIEKFQSTTSATVEIMSNCLSLANTSVSDTTNSSNSFEDIAQATRRIFDMVAQIATAAEQQSAVTEEIDKNTNAINELSEGFLSESKTSEQQAVELEEQALEMSVLVKQFKLRTH